MRLIDADELIDSLGCYTFMTGNMIRWFKHIINDQETAGSPKEGRWIPEEGVGFECSECWRVNKYPTLYCPSCGSRNKKV